MGEERTSRARERQGGSRGSPAGESGGAERWSERSIERARAHEGLITLGWGHLGTLGLPDSSRTAPAHKARADERLALCSLERDAAWRCG